MVCTKTSLPVTLWQLSTTVHWHPTLVFISEWRVLQTSWSLWALALGPLHMNLYWIHSHLLVSPPPFFPNFDPSYFCSFSLVSAFTSSFNLSSAFHFSSPYLFLLVGHTSDFLEAFISKSLHFSTIKSTKMRCLSAHTLPFFPPQYAKFPYLLKLLHLLCWILSFIWSRASLLQISIWFL